MRPFQFVRAASLLEAVLASSGFDPEEEIAPFPQYLAGGTTLLDLMKLDVVHPSRLVDINQLDELSALDVGPGGLVLGAMVRMSEAADHPELRKNYPVISQTLEMAASGQIRNMASLGGNVLQRTRCPYFRDTSYPNCNKRSVGSGCAAFDGINRHHAVLGTSERCIATYPGDFAQALIALDASVDIVGPNGGRTITFADLHRLPGDTPGIETTLAAGELIVAFRVPATPFARRSLFLKIRDRQSYEFALASAAVALDLDGETIREARIALGGVATVPWRARAAERFLAGRNPNDETLATAGDLAFADATPREHNSFKVELGKRTLRRALHDTAKMEI